MHQLSVFNFFSGFSKDFINQQNTQFLITFRIQLRTVDREVFFRFGIPLLRRGECVNEKNFILVGHFLHCFGIQKEIFVLLLAIRQIIFSRKVFKSDRRDDHQLRCRGAVILLL
ncbi:hypothetical protein D3C87_1790960 [compost metagenome]